MITFRGWLALVGGRLLDYLYAGWIWVFFFLLLISTASAIVTGYHTHLRNLDRYSGELQQRFLLQMQALVGPNGRGIDRSLRVLRPPSPTAIVIPGHESSLPAAWDIGPAGLETLGPYPPAGFAAEAGLVLDGEAVIRLFGGLFAIAFGAWTISRDKLRRWSDAEALLPVPEWSVTAAHALAGCVVIAVAVTAWFGTTALFTRVYLPPEIELAMPWARIGLVALLYMVTLFGVGSAITWWARSPLIGVSLAGATWVLLVLLGPQLLLAISNLVSQLPSRATLEQRQRDEHRDLLKQADDNLGRQLVAAAAIESIKTAGDERVNLAYPIYEPEWLARLQAARSSVERAESVWRQDQKRVTGRLRLAARFTPGTLLRQALSEVSSVGWLADSRWEEALDEHRRRLNQALFDDRPSANPRLQFPSGPELWARVRHRAPMHSTLPQFDAPGISPRDRVAAAWPDVMALFVQSLIALLLAGIARHQALRRLLVA